jgi:hypothetical protein
VYVVIIALRMSEDEESSRSRGSFAAVDLDDLPGDE